MLECVLKLFLINLITLPYCEKENGEARRGRIEVLKGNEYNSIQVFTDKYQYAWVQEVHVTNIVIYAFISKKAKALL